MKGQLEYSKFNWSLVALLMILLLGGLISGCSSSDTPTAAVVAEETDEVVQATTEVASDTPTPPSAIAPTDEGVADIAATIVEGDLGEVSLISDNDSDKQVIVFEERHDSRAGQLEIAVMLFRLYRDYNLQQIALEGALKEDGPLDGSEYHQLTDANTMADIAVQTLKKGEISSAEFMAMTPLSDIAVQGIEIAKEYAVEPGEDAGSAPTLYLFYIAVPYLTNDQMLEFNELYEADKILEAVEFVISTDEWTQNQYEKLTDSDTITSAEELIVILEDIEAKADEVDADIEAELKDSLQDYKHFFEVASQRSDTMVDNTLEMLQERPGAPIAMIIGAAHTARVSELLDNQGVSHVVIRPNALATEEPGELTFEAYERKLQGSSVGEEGELGALLDGRKKPPPVLQQPWLEAEAEVNAATVKLARAVASGAQPPFDKPPYDLQTEFAKFSRVTADWSSIVIEGDEVPKEVVLKFDVRIDDAGTTKSIYVRAVQVTGDTVARPTAKTVLQLLEEAYMNTGDATNLERVKQLLEEALENLRNETSSETLQPLLEEAFENVSGETNLETLQSLLKKALVEARTGINLDRIEQLLLQALEDVRSEVAEEQPSYDNKNPAVTLIAHDVNAKFSTDENAVMTAITGI